MDRLNENIPTKTAKRVILHFLILAISITVAVSLVGNADLSRFVRQSSGLTFVGAALVAGFFFSSVLTSAIATASFLILGQNHNPLVVSAIGGVGAAIGDGLILKIIKNDVIADLEVLTKPFAGRTKFIFQSKILHKPLAILAAVIIASPLPDELGLTILGLIKFKPKHFYVLSFFLNTIGILTITAAGSFF